MKRRPPRKLPPLLSVHVCTPNCLRLISRLRSTHSEDLWVAGLTTEELVVAIMCIGHGVRLQSFFLFFLRLQESLSQEHAAVLTGRGAPCCFPLCSSIQTPSISGNEV